MDYDILWDETDAAEAEEFPAWLEAALADNDAHLAAAEAA